jgi:hypothetical protein
LRAYPVAEDVSNLFLFSSLEGRLEFRVLGPLEVRVGERLVSVPGAKQRTLLAGCCCMPTRLSPLTG